MFIWHFFITLNATANLMYIARPTGTPSGECLNINGSGRHGRERGRRVTQARIWISRLLGATVRPIIIYFNSTGYELPGNSPVFFIFMGHPGSDWTWNGSGRDGSGQGERIHKSELEFYSRLVLLLFSKFNISCEDLLIFIFNSTGYKRAGKSRECIWQTKISKLHSFLFWNFSEWAPPPRS